MGAIDRPELRIKAKPMRQVSKGYEPCDPSEATHIRLHMPGPFPNRILPVQPNSPKGWSWNGSVDSPTVTPSILTRLSECKSKELICHSFVTDGRVNFLTDCTHQFAGRTVDLLDIE